jgi:hypothetical protein
MLEYKIFVLSSMSRSRDPMFEGSEGWLQLKCRNGNMNGVCVHRALSLMNEASWEVPTLNSTNKMYTGSDIAIQNGAFQEGM